jgi:hypothetical protein
MFHSKTADAAPSHADVEVDTNVSTLIPLSHLQLDLQPPVEGWNTYLNGRGIAVVTDDLGRLAVARDDARRLFVERREAEAKARAHAVEVELQMIEADRLRRAQLGTGISAAALNGMSYGEAVQEAELNSRPYSPRASVVEDLLGGGGGMVFHPIRSNQDEAS